MLIIFDMGNVVCTSVEILPRMAEKTGIALPRLRHALGYDFFGLSTGEISTPEFWKLFEEEFHTPFQENYLSSLFHPREDSSLAELILELRRGGHRVVCGTNTIESHYQVHREREDYRHFDAVYASHLMGLAKPDPEFFHYIAQQEGYSKNNYRQICFIDDFKENAEAAAGTGIRAHHYRGLEPLLSFLSQEGVIL